MPGRVRSPARSRVQVPRKKPGKGTGQGNRQRYRPRNREGAIDTNVTESVEEAAHILRAGGIVAFPTETVYGLGADAFHAEAVARVFAAKDRPADNPTIVHIADVSQLRDVATHVSGLALQLLKEFAPGPITVVVPRSLGLPDIVTAGLPTVAVRIPSHPTALELLRRFGRPIAAPSANRSGRPSPTHWQAVLRDLDGRIDAILRGERSAIGLESTVVDCTGSAPAILRPGAVTADQVEAATGVALTAPVDAARSPGTRHRHYAPTARVVLASSAEIESVLAAHPGVRCAFIGLATTSAVGPEAAADATPDSARFKTLSVCGSVDEYAHNLYAFFRRCDAEGIELVVCQTVGPQGVGAALMDRVERAARATDRD